MHRADSKKHSMGTKRGPTWVILVSDFLCCRSRVFSRESKIGSRGKVVCKNP